MEGIGKRLKLERVRLGFSQAILAGIGGVATNAQGHYESGQRKPRADYLFKLAVAGVNIGFVVTGSHPQPSIAELGAASAAATVDDNAPRIAAPQCEAKIIEHLHQGLWSTAAALEEVYKLIDPSDQRTGADHVTEYFGKVELLRRDPTNPPKC
jgi:transcriptional regulator with XRE-family HTH domain